ncbi:cold shock-like protein CspF [Salmonella enterica]|nr:cold shock-like protein CspF [Salmonella enterica subsp. enterica serovar Havana]EKA3171114.1 cold shock-like protein CspF [Salmonella enterica]EDV2876396.1 cold shock-like protein CspF [Salmonella enterica subsp. enterica serovar Havana]EKR0769517.1 cold shock-like protein CspF [Salmonella enterica]ELL9257619.1 cold shock-like protein CspF [Salmonella enterica]
MSRKMTGIVKTFDCKSGKGLITPSDGRKDVQVHISACRQHETEALIPGIRVEFCRINGLRGPTAANVYLSYFVTRHFFRKI